MTFVAGDLETVYRVIPPDRDSFGDPVEGQTDQETSIPGCLFAPGTGGENGSRFGIGRVGDNQVEVNAVLYAPPGTVVQPKDRIRARGIEYQVVGYPLGWGAAGVEIPLHYVEG